MPEDQAAAALQSSQLQTLLFISCQTLLCIVEIAWHQAESNRHGMLQ